MSDEPTEDEVQPTENPTVERRPSFIERQARVSLVPEPMGMTDLQFVSINKHFEEVLSRCGEDENLRSLCPEFTYLLDKVRMQYSYQRQLIRKLAEMNAELALKDQEKERIVDSVEERENLISTLKLEIEQAQLKYDGLVKQKDDALHKLDEVTAEMRLVRKKAADVQEVHVTRQTDSSSSALRRQIMALREEMIGERELLQVEVDNERKKLIEMDKEKSQLMLELKDVNDQLKKCSNDLLICKSDLQSEIKQRVKVDRELFDLRKDMKDRLDIIKQLSHQLKDLNFQLSSSKAKAKMYEEEYCKFKSDSEDLSKQLEKLKLEFNARGDKVVLLITERDNVQEELKLKSREVQNLKREISVLKKDSSSAVKHLASLESFKVEALDKINEYYKDKTILEKNLEETLSELSQQKRDITRVEKDREALKLDMKRTEKRLVSLTCEITLKNEINKTTSIKLEEALANLEKEKQKENELLLEKNRQIAKIKALEQRVINLNDEINIRDKKLEKIRKDLSATEKKLKDAIDLQKVTADSLFRSNKALEEAKYEVTKEIGKTSSAENYVELLKNNIRNIEKLYSVSIEKNKKFENEVTSLKQQLTKQITLVTASRKEVSEMENQITFLNKDSKQKDKQIQRLQNEIETITDAKNHINSLLTSKEKELNEQNETIKIKDLEKIKMEEETCRMLKDLRLMKSTLMQESQKRGILEKRINSLPILRRELTQTQQRLTTEQLRSKAMEVETIRPMNVHRMRFLTDAQPERCQLIIKNMLLQKKLVKKDAKLALKVSELEDCRKAIEQLRQNLKRQPSLDAFNKISLYRGQCRKLKDKCNSLTAQVHMYESCYADFKVENVKLKDKLNKTKMAQYKKQLKGRLVESK